MVKSFVFIILQACCLVAAGQSLNSINYSYLYDPATEFTFQWRVVKKANGLLVLYQFETQDINKPANGYTLKFETRKTLGEREGTQVSANPEILVHSNNSITGKVVINTTDPYVAVRVESPGEKKRVWYIFTPVSQAEPFYATDYDVPVVSTYLHKDTPYVIQGDSVSRPLTVSYYDDDFPAAAPAFSTGQAKVSRLFRTDSVFTVSHTPTAFTRNGLYLFQTDTTATAGLAMRVETDYPKLATLETLAGPLVYICTRQEYEKILNANGDKKKFDQVILGITGNSERARNFMRNYFRRVEQANKYFSSYKEGWKTDRGMVYIIFGEPQTVYLFDDREVWEYKGTVNLKFQFVRSSTIFDTGNFVLIREKRFTDPWYQVIDLWRKARF